TVALLNTAEVRPGKMRDADALFQARLTVRAAGNKDCFVERSGAAPLANDDDLRSYRLLYRNAVSFPVGHGCSVEWAASTNPRRACEVRTAHIPTHELHFADSNPDLESPILQIRRLAEGDRSDVLNGLKGFCDDYLSWVRNRRQEIDA